ncbi:MAG: hypothetical protein LBO67_06505 [Spirochaetaceae bacterium]|nr:hypothetical protein [Spirochaetaceae bacterium]
MERIKLVKPQSIETEENAAVYVCEKTNVFFCGSDCPAGSNTLACGRNCTDTKSSVNYYHCAR